MGGGRRGRAGRGGPGSGGEPVWRTRAFGLEKRYLSEAMSRQKANQIVKQVAGGKTWEGPAFLWLGAAVCRLRGGEHMRLRSTLTSASTHSTPSDPSRSPTPSPPFRGHPCRPGASAGVSAPSPSFHAEGEPALRGPFAASVSHPQATPLARASRLRIIDPTPFTFLTPLMPHAAPSSHLAPVASLLAPSASVPR